MDKRPCCSCCSASPCSCSANMIHCPSQARPWTSALAVLAAVHLHATAFGFIATLLLSLITLRATLIPGLVFCRSAHQTKLVHLEQLRSSCSCTLWHRISRRITPLPSRRSFPGGPLNQLPSAMQPAMMAAAGGPPVPHQRQNAAAAAARPAAAARCAAPSLLHRLGRTAAATRSAAWCSAAACGALWPPARHHCSEMPRGS